MALLAEPSPEAAPNTILASVEMLFRFACTMQDIQCWLQVSGLAKRFFVGTLVQQLLPRALQDLKLKRSLTGSDSGEQPVAARWQAKIGPFMPHLWCRDHWRRLRYCWTSRPGGLTRCTTGSTVTMEESKRRFFSSWIPKCSFAWPEHGRHCREQTMHLRDSTQCWWVGCSCCSASGPLVDWRKCFEFRCQGHCSRCRSWLEKATRCRMRLVMWSQVSSLSSRTACRCSARGFAGSIRVLVK